MARNQRTQKQIAEKYKGNLDYFKKANSLRRMRLLLCLLAMALGTAGVVWFNQYGSFYNSRPLSAKHAHQDCTVCHGTRNGAVSGLVSLIKAEPGAPDLPTIARRLFTKTQTREEFDRACMKCHEGRQIHRPDLQIFAMRQMLGQVALVHADACSSCHHEHQGPAPMKMPTTADCVACHADAKRMRVKTLLPPLGAEPPVRPGPEVREVQPGTWQFLPPQGGEAGRSLRPITSFENGHPAFGYEGVGMRDPDPLKYNHQRHEAADIPKINGKKLDCVYCHQAVGDGSNYARVTFENACKACHALLFDPKNPELQVPHGAPEAVRAYLRSLPFQYADLAAKKGFKTPQQASGFVVQQMLQLKERVRSGEDFEKQVFFTANPYKAQAGGGRALFPGCAYCHEVKPGLNGAPQIARPVMADRWLLRGRFSHPKHGTMACADCHDARHSQASSDILMPTQKSCAECHRTRITKPEAEASPQKPLRPRGSPECLSCHSFHAAPAVAGNL